MQESLVAEWRGEDQKSTGKSARFGRHEADDGERVKRQSEGKGSEEQLFTDKRADTWPQPAGRWQEAKRTVSSRDGAACHDLSRAPRTPGGKKPQIIFTQIISRQLKCSHDGNPRAAVITFSKYHLHGRYPSALFSFTCICLASIHLVSISGAAYSIILDVIINRLFQSTKSDRF